MRQAAKTIDQIEETLNAKPAPEPMPTKREFVTVMEPNGLYHVELTGGGRMPDALKGKYTNVRRAQITIDNYITTRDQALAE